jgi:hypothetical protein
LPVCQIFAKFLPNNTWQTFAKLPNGLPNGLPLRLKKYGIAPEFGATSKDSNYI